MRRAVPVSRAYIEALLPRVDALDYGVSVRGGLDPASQRLRNKALIAFLYLSARRISEVVGLVSHPSADAPLERLPGVMLKDIRYDTLAGRPVMIVRCRILKKRKPEYGEVIIDLDEAPFIHWVKLWVKHQEAAGEPSLFPMSRSRAYQILQQIDPAIVGPHWFRHARCSHLADSGLDVYQLTERVGFWNNITPSINYVHGRVTTYLDALAKAREE